MELGVSREDAYNYIPVGCNELGIPGQFYFNPGAGVDYLSSIELALTSGKGYKGQRKAEPLARPPGIEDIRRVRRRVRRLHGGVHPHHIRGGNEELLAQM